MVLRRMSAREEKRKKWNTRKRKAEMTEGERSKSKEGGRTWVEGGRTSFRQGQGHRPSRRFSFILLIHFSLPFFLPPLSSGPLSVSLLPLFPPRMLFPCPLSFSISFTVTFYSRYFFLFFVVLFSFNSLILPFFFSWVVRNSDREL